MQNYKNLSARVLSLALSAAMVFTSFSTTVFAAEEAAPLGVSGALTTDSIITAFDALGEGFEKSEDGHTYLRSVELNTPFEEVGLPTELGVTVKHPTTDTEPTATEPVATEPATTEPATTEPTATEATTTEPATTEPVATEPATTEPVATEAEAEKKSAPEQISSATIVADEMIPVTWNGDRDYTPAEDSKVLYTAVLPEGYALADGAKLPTINVMVGKQPIAAMPRAGNTIEVDGTNKTLQAAVDEVAEGDTIKLMNNIDRVSVNIDASNAHNFTLDLNGHNLTATNASVLTNGSPTTLTITDSSAGTAGSIIVGTWQTAVQTSIGSTLNIYKVTIQGGNNSNAIFNSGTLNIHSGTVQGTGEGKAIENNGTVNISGGTVQETGSGKAILNRGTVNISGGTVQGTGTSKAIENSGTVNITGGTVQAENNAALSNSWGDGKYIISGADTVITSAATGENGTVCFSGELGEGYKTDLLTITGGTISNTNPENYSVYFAADTGVTGDNLDTYYKAEGATVGNVFPVPTAPKVSFDARNGAVIPSVTIDKVTHKIDDAAMPANPTWAGYDFGGWYTDVDGKGTAFKNENLTASVTAYAKWTKNGKTVRTEPLDLTGAATNLNGDGWKWDNTAKTLTLDGITLNSSKLDNNNNASGILFPADAPSTIILVDGTENTVDVSAAKGSINNSQAIYATNKLTIKTSGKGTPGKLNAIAGKSKNGPSFGIYAGGGLLIESGNITATAGESVSDNSVGMSANTADIHIKGGTVNATGGISGGTGMAGSFGLYGNNVRIDDGTVTATGGEATTGLKLSAGIVGDGSVKLNGGNIHANGNTAAVAALAVNGVAIDDITNVTVNDKLANVGSMGMGIYTLLDADGNVVKDAKVKFKPNYTGTNTLAPNAYKAIKTHDSITLPTQAVAGETVEYGIEKLDGTIEWKDTTTFDGLTADTNYKFYTRVKGNAEHKAGTTSAATTIKTKITPVRIAGTILDSDGSPLVDATVTLKQGKKVINTATTIAGGTYVLNDVPGGVYSLVITKGAAPDTVTITETVTVAGGAMVLNTIKFLDGKKNTVVESADNAPEVAVGGMNALLNPTNLNETLKTPEEQAAVAGGGSVDLTFKADLKTTSGGAADKSAIEGIADPDQQIDLLLDLSVQKTVRARGGALVKDEKIPSLADIIEVYLPIPADLQGKTNLRLYRIHNGTPELLGKDLGNANTDGEYYTIDPSGTFMTLFVKNFSTYALGYSAFTVTIVDGGTGASVSGSGKYSDGDTVTINAGSKSGYSFDGWTVAPATVILSNPSSATTTFVMPAEAVTVTAVWTSTGGGSGSGGSGGGSSDDNGEYEFWMQGMDKIDTAKSGDVIKLNLKSNDKMPASVMAALRKNPGVSLVITWNGGKTITIPAGKAAKQEDGRLYYPLSMLAELYAGYTEDSVLKSTAPQNPQTGGPGSFISAAGGELITLEAPTPALTENAQANTITPPDAGFEASAFAGTPDESAAQGTSPIAVAALVLLLAALGGGWVLLWKRDSKEQE